MMFFILLVFSVYSVLTTRMFYRIFAGNIFRNTGRKCRFAQEGKDGNVLGRVLKTAYIREISWWLYGLFLLHLSACAALLVSVVLFEVCYFDQIRLVLLFTMVVEAVSFVPASLNLYVLDQT